MGFRKVQAALSEYLNSKAACRVFIKFSDIVAVALALLCLINAFITIPFFGALLPYLVLAGAVFSLASDGKLGLLIITGSQALVAFIGMIKGMLNMFKFGIFGGLAFPLGSLFALLFWGGLTFLVVYAVCKDGLGSSMLMDLFKSASAPKTPARNCPACGFPETNPTSSFCRNCGGQLPPVAPVAPAPAAPAAPKAQAICPNCGKPVDGDAAFCVICGTKLK